MKASEIETGEASMIQKSPAAGINRGMTILDVILRLVAIASTVAGAVVMATSDQQLQFFTQVAVFNVEYDDFSTLRYLRFSVYVFRNRTKKKKKKIKSAKLTMVLFMQLFCCY